MERNEPELPDPCQAAWWLLHESCDAAGMGLFVEAQSTPQDAGD